MGDLDELGSTRAFLAGAVEPLAVAEVVTTDDFRRNKDVVAGLLKVFAGDPEEAVALGGQLEEAIGVELGAGEDGGAIGVGVGVPLVMGRRRALAALVLVLIGVAGRALVAVLRLGLRLGVLLGLLLGLVAALFALFTAALGAAFRRGGRSGRGCADGRCADGGCGGRSGRGCGDGGRGGDGNNGSGGLRGWGRFGNGTTTGHPPETPGWDSDGGWRIEEVWLHG